MRSVTIQRFVTLWLAFAACTASRADGDAGAVGTSATALKAAVAIVGQIYEQKIAGVRTPADRAALAREIFENRAVAESPAERYGVLVTALNVATKGDDALLLLQISNELATNFELDRSALLSERIGQTAGAIDPTTWPQCLQEMTALISECSDAGRFTEASKLVVALSALAKRARDPKGLAQAMSLRKTIAARQKAHEQFESLRSGADQPAADAKVLLEFGRLLCFTKNEWFEGSRYLVRAADPVLSRPAAIELRIKTVDEKLGAADAWAKAAEEAELPDRRPIREHAAALYMDVLPSLTGLAKVRVENALEQVLKSLNASEKGVAQNQWTVIFRSAKPDVWNTDARGSATDFAIPLTELPPLVRYVRLRRANGAAVILRIDRGSLGSETKTQPYAWNGTNLLFSGDRMLGISDRRTNVDNQTGAVAVSRADGYFSGWGFGHRIHHGGEAELCWNGQWIAREPLEIAVVDRALNPEEERFLLR